MLDGGDESSMNRFPRHRFDCLFTVVRGRGILGSSDARSCIYRPSRAARMACEGRHAAWAGSTCCGAGWICRKPNTLGLRRVPYVALCKTLPDAHLQRIALILTRMHTHQRPLTQGGK